MDKREGGTLNNWFLGTRGKSMVVCGWISGDVGWIATTALRTSTVVSLNSERVETLNTVYQLGKHNASDANRADWMATQGEYWDYAYIKQDLNENDKG